MTRGSCNWNAQRPPPAGPNAEQHAPSARQARTARPIGDRLAPRRALVASGAGEAKRLEAENREDAGHDVEQKPAEQGAGEGEKHRVRVRSGGPPSRPGRRSVRDAGRGAYLQALSRPELEHALDRAGDGPPRPGFDDQPSPRATPPAGRNRPERSR